MVARRVKGTFEAVVHEAKDDAAAGEVVRDLLARAKGVVKDNMVFDVDKIEVTGVAPDG